MDDQFVERLKQETGLWQQERLISERQARGILARHGLVEGELEERQSKLVYALGFIGALLVGIGAITFFAANWPFIPGWCKLLLIVASVVAAYTAGYWMCFERQWSPRVGSALIFLGSLLFGAAIFLIAQGFHIRANEPTLLYLWALGILPMAYLLAAPSMVYVAVLAVAIGLGWELNQFHPIFHIDFFPALSVYLMLGVFLYSLGELHRRSEARAELHAPYLQLGLFLGLGVLYLLSFGDMWRSGSDRPEERLMLFSHFWWRMMVLTIGAAAFTIARWAQVRGAAGVLGVSEFLSTFILIGVGWGLAFAGGGTNLGDGFYPPEAIAVNLLLFACTLGVITQGYLERRPALVNTGIFFFGLHLLTRYFDIFGRLLHTSAVFAGAGLILLLGGIYLERTRRALVRHMAERPA